MHPLMYDEDGLFDPYFVLFLVVWASGWLFLIIYLALLISGYPFPK